ncbi:MAG: zinc ribbon domain-containing protein [Pseudomonadales bacterium]|nr:zinc ribbon domain-containing protein [Pseudomonadales bacterium]
MPSYQFQCEKCGNRFSIVESMSQHEKHQEKCPQCSSAELKTRLSAVYVKTSKKS